MCLPDLLTSVQIHREAPRSHFTAAIAGLLFLAVCAYLGTELYERLSPDIQTVRAELFSIKESTELSGIAIRQEQVLFSQGTLALTPENGKKYAAGESICVLKSGQALEAPSPGLFYENTDGFEYLSPEYFLPFSHERFLSAMDLSAEKYRDFVGRIILDDAWFFAAEILQGPLPQKGSRCRISFQGIEQGCDALVWDTDEQSVLLRLNAASDALMSLRKSNAELVINEYRGLKIPGEALRRDGEGSFYVCVLSSGLEETRSVDIIYTGDGFSLAQQSFSADSLREGELIIVTKENSSERVSLDGYR